MPRSDARVAAWLAWGIPFGVFLASLNGAVLYWDTGEAQTVPWIFGIMHPTGFPAFTVLAGIFAHVLPFGAVSWRIALFSALAMSGAAWLVSRIIEELEGDPWFATAAAWLFAFGQVAWTRGTRAEVHALAAFFGVLTIYAIVRWYRRSEPAALVAAALAWGLGIATHPIVALLLPALLLALAARIRHLSLRTFALAFAALLASLSLYAYLPVRSAAVTAARLDPTRQLGLPTGQSFWDNDHPASLSGFMQEVSGQEFSAGGTFGRMLLAQTYAEGGEAYELLLLREMTPFGVLLALGGLYALARRDGLIASALLLTIAIPSAFAVAYTIETDPQRYDLIPFAIVAALAGLGASEIVRALPSLRNAALVAFASLSIALLIANGDTFNQRTAQGARAVITTAAEKTPPNAVLIASWLYATPLAYGSYVERSLGRRIVISAWLSENARRVPRWLRTRPVYVVGQVFGEIRGYKLVKVPAEVDLYRVTRSLQASPHSSSPY